MKGAGERVLVNQKRLVLDRHFIQGYFTGRGRHMSRIELAGEDAGRGRDDGHKELGGVGRTWRVHGGSLLAQRLAEPYLFVDDRLRG